ncbi:mevalonate kinase [Candidatus Gottesmanbacteria bacterium]|nr:mevalonate kinase [Candidatus Gottesmanbacteria bacterium]
MKKTNSIRVFAPGKLMLLGEHAVVYGYPCISFAIDRGVTVELSEGLRADKVTSSVSDDRFIRVAKDVFFQKNAVRRVPMHITIKSEISGYGLGSSSAVAVATITALLQFYAISFSKQKVFDLSYEAVKKIQPKASGYDVATTIYGGVILFDGKTKQVKKINIKDFPFLVGFSTVKADTSTLVEQVSEQKERESQRIDAIFSSIGHLVKEGIQAFNNRDWKRLGGIMDENQRMLSMLGVSTNRLDEMIFVAKHHGALGAKLSGAGGGDCIIVLCWKNSKQIMYETLKKAGIPMVPLNFSSKGVRQL